MTKEEAATVLENALVCCGNAPVEATFEAGCDEVCDALQLAISALREQTIWISVEEILPDDNEKVIVYTRSGKMCVARWSARQNKFVSSGNLTVTHWMPLPDVPKE